MYFACEDLEFTFTESEVALFDRLWNEGVYLVHIADELKRDPDECVILCIDRIRNSAISKRVGGVYGTIKHPPKKRGRPVAITHEQYLEYRTEGLNDTQIAKKVRIANLCYYKRKWRNELNGSIKGSQSRV